MIASDVSPGYSPPSPPLIPFALPGGRLRVTICSPTATVRDLGSEPFAQSFVRSETTAGGYNLNPETVHLHDVYSLKAATDRFRITFDQDGHTVITMTGELEDIWGNRYTGGGTYDVWVASPLVLAPGVLPGTPFDVGDTFNPALQLAPRRAGRRGMDDHQYPDSDPARATRRTISGRANPFGAFSGPGVTFDAPGEYRVDVTATYRDRDGGLAMGAMTWGGIVMTPRGMPRSPRMAGAALPTWRTSPARGSSSAATCSMIPASIPQAFPPYYAGDIIWSRRESADTCPAESLQVAASIQDTSGTLDGVASGHGPTGWASQRLLPGDLDERFAHGELPLFTSTRSGRSPQMAPDDVDQIAYAYFSAQRPGIRVREEVTEEDGVRQLLAVRHALRWPGGRGDRGRPAE